MSDLYEMKSAILAAKENTNLPIFAIFKYQSDDDFFTKTDPLTATITLQSLGVDALGVNMSISSPETITTVEKMLEYSKVPVIVQANWDHKKDLHKFSKLMSEIVSKGTSLIAGGCATTPEFINKLRIIADSSKPFERIIKTVTAVTSSTRTVVFDEKIIIIGERINPTGKKRLQDALLSNQMTYIRSEAIDQANMGADILDINTTLPHIDEISMLARLVKEVQSVSSLPLQIDSSSPEAIESGVRACNGRPIINSVNGAAESMAKIFPIAKKYGAVIIGLTLDESGIPPSAEDRFLVAKRIIDTAGVYGIPKEDILIDCLALTASTHQDFLMDTLEAIQLVKSRLGVKTVLGISNVSFGLPNREILNRAFLSAALGAGLDAPILDPLSKEVITAIELFKVFNGQDKKASKYIEKYSTNQIQTEK